MKIIQTQTIKDFLSAGEETTRELFQKPNELVSALEQADRFFTECLWSGEPAVRPVPALLAMNAYSYLLAGIRMGLTGHEAAVYPVLRTALESACYAYRSSAEPRLDEVWMERHRDRASMRRCRREFGPAVADTAKALGKIDPSYQTLISDSYDAAIDFGAHPNPRGVLGHLKFKEAVVDGRYHQLDFAMLYPSDSWNTQRGLLACLDYAVIAGLILIHTHLSPTTKAAEALRDLNDRKNEISDAINKEALRSWGVETT